MAPNQIPITYPSKKLAACFAAAAPMKLWQHCECCHTHSDSSATQKTEEAAPKAEEAAPKAEEAAPKAEGKKKRRTGKAVQPHSPASQEGRKLVREAVL